MSKPLRCRGPRSGWRRESPLPKQFEHSFDYCLRLHPTSDKIATLAALFRTFVLEKIVVPDG